MSFEKYQKLLRDDLETGPAKEWFGKHNIPSDWWDEFLSELAHNRAFFESNSGSAERIKCRQSVASKMTAMASALDADPEAKTFYPFYLYGEPKAPTLAVDAAPFDGALTLADWLRDGAEHLQELLIFENNTRSLQRYLIHRVHREMMGRWVAANKSSALPRNPNDAIAGLVNALLSDQEPIDAKTVSNTLRKKRLLPTP